MKPISRNGSVTRALAASLVIAGMVLGCAAPANADDSNRLRLGRITDEPEKNVVRLNALGGYLARHLAPHGIVEVDIVITETRAEMAGKLRNGEVDIFSETPFTALALMDEGLAEPLLREWKKGVPQYHSVIFVRTGSGIESLAELKGKKIAFEDSGSTSGYLLPRAAMGAEGLTFEKLDNPRGEAPADKVGYSFANGEINVVAWVNRGLADAGAISNLDWANPQKAPAQFKESLTIIHETPPVIRSLMMVRPSLDPAMKTRLTAILSDMHETEEGRAALEEYFKVSKFDGLDDTTAADLDAIRRLRRQAGMTSE